MSKRIVIVVILVIVLFMQCSAPANKSLENKMKADTDIINWAKDKNGCLRLRNNVLANKLIKEYHLTNSCRGEFLKVFNSPDKIENVDGKAIITYYWGSVCQAGKLIVEGDKCYATFYFKNDKLFETSFPCE